MVREATSPIAKYADNQSIQPELPPRIFVINNDPMKIWVSLQVPQRSTFCDMLKQRGAALVATEVGADVRIGDHLKQSCYGMISYKWIEECCKLGELVDTESHKIRKPVTNVGSLHRSSRRNEFSAADDRLLIAHIKKHPGAAIQGNRIYDILAAEHPHHPSQSWRNRWVKVLSKRPDVLADIQSTPGVEVDSPQRRPSFGFTREQDGIILKAVTQPGADPEDPAFWERIALTHVSMDMSAEQWQQRYFGRLKPELDLQGIRKEGPARRESPVNAPPAREESSGKEPVREKPHADQDGFRFEAHEEPSESTKRPLISPQPVITKKPRTQPPPTKAPIPKPTETTVFKQTPTSEMRTLSKIPPPRYSLPHQSPRSSSLPTSSRRVTAPIPSSHLKSPSVAPRHINRLSSVQPVRESSSPIVIPTENVIYHNPERRTTIWRTPGVSMGEDDAMVHQRMVSEAMGRTNRIRVSMGDINIEIESNSSPMNMMGTPRGSGIHLRSSPPLSLRSDGTNARRAMGGEIPSTPGSSPIKLKQESSREGDDIMEDIVEETDLRESMVRDEMGEQVQETDPFPEEPLEDEDMDLRQPLDPEEEPSGSRAFGAATQQLFESDDLDDFTIPNVEITPSPRKHPDQHNRQEPTTHSKFLSNTEEWVVKKAKRYNVDPEIIWWVLERTTGRPKIAIKALKSFLKKQVLPDVPGVWTLEEDRILRKRDVRALKTLDEKHGYGASVERQEFLEIWRTTSAEIRE